MEKAKIAFIINPKSGTNSKAELPDMIRKTISPDKFDITIVKTEYAGHGRELARQFVDQHYDYVIACGGDGTMNEVASELTETETCFGIVPYGSGNGLARHLSISMEPQKALRQINKHIVRRIDYGMANDKKFFCTCGTGFDAHVSHKFAIQGKRGFWTYFKTICSEFMKYKPYVYTLKSGSFKITQQAFLVTFANASQYGNNAFIAPQASTSDGLIDVCVLKPFSVFAILPLTFQLFRKEIDKSKYISTIQTPEVTLVRQEPGEFHIDGDPLMMEAEIHVRVIHDALKVIVGRPFNIEQLLRSRLIYARRRIKRDAKRLLHEE
ncbi:MAG: diacylglycerol kinase family lipid kinase [Paludibacteraceae bacterium]|nr:diacylglycerol kinase family lipid kinase [Paludibacteraceae bacterium]